MNEPSRYAREKQQAEIKASAVAYAKGKFAESEWVLHFLRHRTGNPPPTPTDEELIKWEAKLPN